MAMTRIEKIAIDRCTMAARLYVECETLEEFDERFQAAGYAYTGRECDCLDDGERGHHPSCGWDLKGAVISGGVQ